MSEGARAAARGSPAGGAEGWRADRCFARPSARAPVWARERHAFAGRGGARLRGIDGPSAGNRIGTARRRGAPDGRTIGTQRKPRQRPRPRQAGAPRCAAQRAYVVRGESRRAPGRGLGANRTWPRAGGRATPQLHGIGVSGRGGGGGAWARRAWARRVARCARRRRCCCARQRARPARLVAGASRAQSGRWPRAASVCSTRGSSSAERGCPWRAGVRKRRRLRE